jgi:hypothetical protein
MLRGIKYLSGQPGNCSRCDLDCSFALVRTDGHALSTDKDYVGDSHEAEYAAEVAFLMVEERCRCFWPIETATG